MVGGISLIWAIPIEETTPMLKKAVAKYDSLVKTRFEEVLETGPFNCPVRPLSRRRLGRISQ